MKRFTSLLVILLTAFAAYSQSDLAGSGRAMSFDGIDDYIDLGNIYDDLDYPFTVSVWVKTSPSTGPAPILVTQDNDPIYNGFWFLTNRNTFFIEYGDGRGENLPAFRRGKSSTGNAGEWVHLCAVVRGVDNITMYYNGQDAGGTPTGESGLPMTSNYPNDVAKIGYFLSNGNVYRFNGLMDELRVFARELSVNEIRQQMCMRLKGDEPGLVGYWNFDETSGNKLLDVTSNHFDGTLIGNPQRVYSGAPVGNKSVYLYPNSWTGMSLTMTEGSDNLTVNDVKGNPYGVHIYEVATLPSQQNGIPTSAVKSPYYGVFLAADDNNNTFDLQYNGATGCQSYSRTDNTVSTWTNTILPVQDRLFRTEIIAAGGPPLTVNLGTDKQLCDQSSLLIKSGINPAGKTFTWSNGASTPDITVTASGTYILQVSEGCSQGKDTVKITFEKTPHLLSLGSDQQTCTFTPTTLTPITDVPGLVFTWQNGSHGQTFDVNKFGTYWVRAENGCGVLRDTIHLLQLPPDPHAAVDLGPDKTVCNQSQYSLSTGLSPSGKNFTWSTGATTPAVVVNQPGVYHVTVTSQCRIDQDTITLLFEASPHEVLIGDDQIVCAVSSTTLTPVSDARGISFTWQDGSHEPTFEAKDFGTYWVRIENACGVASDTVHIEKLVLHTIPPNVITPNSDGKNDKFILDTEVVGKVNLEIFNRWGTSVYSIRNYQNTWGGEGLSPGVYFYLITSECFKDIRGAVSVLRN